MQRPGPGTWLDDPAHFRRPTRRDFLHVGAVGALGLTLDGVLRQQAQAREAGKREAKAQALIHIFLPGGIAHQESFDPKPNAPLEYRGDMGFAPTKLDGIVLNECLKQTGQIADKITICRSMTHGEAAHERGTHNMFTGYRPSPALQFPSFGSVVAHELGVRDVHRDRTVARRFAALDRMGRLSRDRNGRIPRLGADPAAQRPKTGGT
jgi:hypothetical protein